MKKYIKPSILSLEAETSAIMSGSIDDSGQNGNLNNPGTTGASGARAKHHIMDAIWDENWDTDDEDDNNE